MYSPEIQKKAQEMFDAMQPYELMADLDVPQTVLEAFDYAANYFGDIAKGREWDPEEPKDAFPTLLHSHNESLKERTLGPMRELNRVLQEQLIETGLVTTEQWNEEIAPRMSELAMAVEGSKVTARTYRISY